MMSVFTKTKVMVGVVAVTAVLSQFAAGQVSPSVCADCDASCADCDAAELIQRLGLREAFEPVRDRPGWSPPKRVLVRGGQSLIEWLQPAAPGVELVSVTTRQAAVEQASTADAVIAICSDALVKAGSRVKWFQLPSAGVEYCVNAPGVKERKILVTNAQRLYGPEVAEHAIAMMLAFARGFHRFFPEQVKGRWSPSAVPNQQRWELKNKTLLVAGLGGIGTEVAWRAHALGMRVTATRRSTREGPEYVSYVGLSDELSKLAAEADVVINALPLTPETRAIFDVGFFETMKPTAYFINVGRGKHVVTTDLLDALNSGQIAGAGLDVTDPEPLPPGHPLWSAPNVLITPHAASGSDLASRRLWILYRENLRRYVAGERMLSVVDLDEGY